MSWLRGVSVVVLLAATSACSGGESESEKPALSGATALSIGLNSSCALINDGSVRCWGSNFNGLLGLGSSETSAWAAIRVERVADAIGVAVANGHACAALADGSVKCWGALPTRLRTKPPPSRAMSVEEVTAAQAVAAGREHTCALQSGGTVQCWGNTSLASLGDGSLPDDPRPWSRVASVADLSDATAIVANDGTSCALLGSGELECWGDVWVDGDTLDDESLAGRTWLTTATKPKLIEGLPRAVGIGIADLYGCAVLEDSTVACWGLLRKEMGGTGQPSVIPTTVAGLSDVTAIATGDSHACALLHDGSIRCWGSNLGGQLGDGSEVASPDPVRVQGIDTAVAIAAGGYANCALLADSTVRCWGLNALGCSDSDGRCRNSAVPVVVRAER